MKMIQHPYISENITVQKMQGDFNYVVIDNLLKEDVYEIMCKKFNTYISRCPGARGVVDDGGHFYDALIYGMKPQDCVDGYDFFITQEWYDFIKNIFDIELNQYIAYTLHYHKGSPENPSKDGWPHTDLNIVSVVNDYNTNLRLTSSGGCNYADNTFDRQPDTKKCIRSIALLYYFNNKSPLEENDGGGTNIFSDYDSNSLIQEIKPINNRVFAFEVSPKSYHAFKGAKFDRSAIVQWFHSSPSYILKRNINLFKSERSRKGLPFFEYWQHKNVWEVDRDPEYSKYFDIPYYDLIKS